MIGWLITVGAPAAYLAVIVVTLRMLRVRRNRRPTTDRMIEPLHARPRVGEPNPSKSIKPAEPVGDIYARMPTEIGRAQRDHNRRRLAELTAAGVERQRRLRKLAAMHCHPSADARWPSQNGER